VSVVLAFGDLELFVVSFGFSLLNGGLLFDFPAKFEELMGKLLFREVEGGLVIFKLFPFALCLLPKMPVDFSVELAGPVGELLEELASLIFVRASSRVGEPSFAFKHLFTCSFTEEAGNDRPQIGQSTRLVCDIPNSINPLDKPVLCHISAATKKQHFGVLPRVCRTNKRCVSS